MSTLSADVESVYPLSPTQEGMLYHSLHSPGSGVYIGQHLIRLSHIDPGSLRQAWQMIIDRHMALRSLFVWHGLSRSVQVVLNHSDPDWKIIDMRSGVHELDSWCRADAKTEFEPAVHPPSRVRLLQVGDEQYLMVWTRHHLMVDGWSAHIVLGELRQAYACIYQNRKWNVSAAPGFSDYISWLEQQDEKKSERYWHDILSGKKINPGLDAIKGRIQESRETRRIEIELDKNTSRRLRSAARNHGLTLSTLVHGAWASVLFAINEEMQVNFGSTLSGRPVDLPRCPEIVGNFINTIPLSVALNDRQDLRSWLSDLQQQISEGAAHGHLSNRQMLQAAAIAPGTPLFDSIVVFMNYPKAGQTDKSDLVFETEHYDEHSHYPCAVLAIPDESLKIIIIHNLDQISVEKADMLMSMLTRRLKKLPDALSGVVSEFSNGARPKQSQLATTELQVEPLDVITRFHQTLAVHGNKTALSQSGRRISYTDLNAAALNLAWSLSESGVKPGDKVVLMMPRTIEAIVSLWAILMCGAAYVPLPPGTPRARVESAMKKVRARMLVTDQENSAFPKQFTVSQIHTEPGHFKAIKPEPTAIAYTIFTSGSTGEPKAISLSHRNLAYSLAARLQFYSERKCVYGLVSPLAFDSSVAGIFWMAAIGGCLALIGEDSLLTPQHLVEELEKNKVNTLLTLPSLYRVILDCASETLRKRIQLIIVAGEACPANILDMHKAVFPAASLVNEYGPTEATVWCSAKRFNRESKMSETGTAYLPIGRAVAGVTLHILDRHHRPVPPCVKGELFISGRTVSADSGYDGKYPTGDLVEANSQGEILFHGRRDEQLKIRGHRIDPAEIESVLFNHPDVQDCAVLGITKPLGDDADSLNLALNQLSLDHALGLLAAVENPDA